MQITIMLNGYRKCWTYWWLHKWIQVLVFVLESSQQSLHINVQAETFLFELQTGKTIITDQDAFISHEKLCRVAVLNICI